MEIPLGPFLLLGMLAISLYLFVRYGGTAWHWNVRLWIFHTIWRFSSYFFDSIVFSPNIERLKFILELTEFTVFIIILILIFFLDSRQYGGLIFRNLKPSTIALMSIVVAMIIGYLCWGEGII